MVEITREDIFEELGRLYLKEQLQPDDMTAHRFADLYGVSENGARAKLNKAVAEGKLEKIVKRSAAGNPVTVYVPL